MTFMPIVIALAVWGVCQKSDITPQAFTVVKVILALFLVACLFVCTRFYFRSFVYTVSDNTREGYDNGYPKMSLTFECFHNKKERIYERVMAKEMLALDGPGETAGATAFPPSRTFKLTVNSIKTASRLYYKQSGIIYCSVFHPDAEMTEILQSWINKAKIDS